MEARPGIDGPASGVHAAVLDARPAAGLGGRGVELENKTLSARDQGMCYRGTSVIGKCVPLGPYRRPVPRVLGGS